MSVIKKFFAIAVLLPLALIGGPAYAEYTYQLVIPPGAENSQTWGINNAGKVTGITFDDDYVFSYRFIYDMKSGEYRDIGIEFVGEISNSGVMVGRVDNVCAIRDKQGNITTFFPPSWTVDKFCNARGVNSNGKVSGVVRDAEDDEFGVWTGFIYDPEYDTYEEFLPSGQTIAHAINAQGQNVGSVTLDADEAYEGSPWGRYGYLRQVDGSVKYFAISQSRPGRTRARGISENGLVTGWYPDFDTFEWKGYVTTLSDGNEFEEITLSDDQVVYQKPCDANIPPPPEPEADWVLFTYMTPLQIRNDGVILGICSDYYYNETTDVWIEHTNGFIATPIK